MRSKICALRKELRKPKSEMTVSDEAFWFQVGDAKTGGKP